jgi:aflatoxin B1 aldehyde reductase
MMIILAQQSNHLLLLLKSPSNKTYRVREMYWNKITFEAIDSLTKAATAHNLTLLEATLRWMRHHSGLTSKDAILIGSSKVEQLEETLRELEKGPLPKEMIKAFDEAWEHVKPIARSYFFAENDVLPSPKRE